MHIHSLSDPIFVRSHRVIQPLTLDLSVRPRHGAMQQGLTSVRILQVSIDIAFWILVAVMYNLHYL